ncbi:transcriptional regulator NrdR [bacterium]|nr:transcriptional regulator NrdR [bacterium]
MKCPRCGHEDDKVIDSRAVRDGRAVRRRRECTHCTERFTTYEAIETRPVLVVKRSGDRVAYNRAKVIVGVTKACEKRPVALEEIEIIVDHVELKLAASGRREVPSETIGRYVLEELRQVDEVAYVRFASVYRSFQNVDEFFQLLRDLKDTPPARDEDA